MNLDKPLASPLNSLNIRQNLLPRAQRDAKTDELRIGQTQHLLVGQIGKVLRVLVQSQALEPVVHVFN
jgi:hypothetical protein